jgi:hypothetical protein
MGFFSSTEFKILQEKFLSEAAGFSEMLVPVFHNTRRIIPPEGHSWL